MLHEEKIQRDELHNLKLMMKKQIETLGVKHDRNTGHLERGLTNINDTIDNAVK